MINGSTGYECILRIEMESKLYFGEVQNAQKQQQQ